MPLDKKNTTIHIFAYGEAQIISQGLNYKTDVKSFTKLQAVIDDAKSQKPSDVPDSDYHHINIFTDMNGRWFSDGKEGSFTIDFTKLDSAKLNDIITEFRTLKDASDAATSKK
jgi:hypothetical protein